MEGRAGLGSSSHRFLRADGMWGDTQVLQGLPHQNRTITGFEPELMDINLQATALAVANMVVEPSEADVGEPAEAAVGEPASEGEGGLQPTEADVLRSRWQ